MGRKMKKLTRAGAGALAGVMVFGLAAPLAPLSVEAADEVKNLAIGSTATVNDKETDYWGADKAVDGIVNRTAAKRDQSRWATNVGGDADAKWLKIDLKEAKTFQSFVLAWERRNITGYKIQISQTGEDNSWEDVYTKTGASHISHINENIHLPEAKQHVMYVYILTDIRRMRQMIRQIGDQFLFMTSRSMQMRFLIRFSRMKTTVWKEQQNQAILKRFKASRENKVRQKRLTEI